MKKREASLVLVLLGVFSFGISQFENTPNTIPIRNPESPDWIAYGRSVYVDEGCIHCHSQYVRPVEMDRINWGPELPEGAYLDQEPVLIGNRRQGPDLSEIGLRRSREWNQLHLENPAQLTPGSRMPSYASLFMGDGVRGTALLDYLDQLHSPTGWEQRSLELSTWTHRFENTADPANGQILFEHWCSQCHGVDGTGNGPLAERLSVAPRNLQVWINASENTSDWRTQTARVIRFGLTGTTMPGHEFFTDQELSDLIAHLNVLGNLSQ
jgi:cytochrome c oxidase cbb3-type subunit 2